MSEMVLSIKESVEADIDTHVRIKSIMRRQLGLKVNQMVYLYTKQGRSLGEFKVKPAFRKDIARYKGIRNVIFLTKILSDKPVVISKTRLDEEDDKKTDVKPPSILVGSDPELLLFDTNTGVFVDAGKICTGVLDIDKYAEFGWDGGMMEMRPPARSNTTKHIDEIRRILKENTQKLGDRFKLQCGCFEKTESRSYPVGGHIHLGNDSFLNRISDRNKHNFFRVACKIMTENIGILLTAVDGVEGYKRRTNMDMYGKFGMLGDWRVSGEHFEWRMPSGLWMISDEFACAVVATAKAVYEACLYACLTDRGKDRVERYIMGDGDNTKFGSKISDLSAIGKFNYGDILYKVDSGFNWNRSPLANIMGASKDVNYINRIMLDEDPDKAITTKIIDASYKEMSNIPTYDRYKKHIDVFFDVVAGDKEVFRRENRNLEKWLY